MSPERYRNNAIELIELLRRALEGIAPYPGDGPLDVAKTGVERDINVRYGGLAWRHSDADFYFHTGRLSPLYAAEDRKAWDAGSAFTMTTMWPKLAAIDFFPVKRLDVPGVFFLGRHDTTTPSGIAERWLAAADAPSKRIVWFERSAHLPIVEEPGRTLQALVDIVRPLAKD